VLAVDEDGVVAVGALGDVSAYDLGGHERWNVGLLNGPVYWRPALTRGMVFVSLGDRLVALDRATGAGRWQRRLTDPGRLALGLASDGAMTLAVTTADGSVLALRPETGALLWGMHFPGVALAAPSVTVSDGRAYVAVASVEHSQVAAFDLTTGQERWHQAISPYAAEPAVASGLVLIAERVAEGSRLRALDAGTGTPQWQVPLTGTFLPGFQAAIGAGEYIVGDDEGDLQLVDLGPRTVRWKRGFRLEGVDQDSADRITPLVAGPRVFVTADGHGLVSFDRRTGHLRSREGDRGFLRSAAVLGPTVFVLTGVGTSGMVSAQRA
jgi:outer membrane protein assembly factor BamB